MRNVWGSVWKFFSKGKVERWILGSIIGETKKPERRRREARSCCERWIFGLERGRSIEVNYQTMRRRRVKDSSGRWVGFSRQKCREVWGARTPDPVALLPMRGNKSNFTFFPINQHLVCNRPSILQIHPLVRGQNTRGQYFSFKTVLSVASFNVCCCQCPVWCE